MVLLLPWQATDSGNKKGQCGWATRQLFHVSPLGELMIDALFISAYEFGASGLLGEKRRAGLVSDTPFELHLHLVSRQSGSPMRRGIRYNLEGPIRFQESGSTPPYRPRPKRVSVEIHHATHSLHGVRKQQSCGAGSEVRRNRRACAETQSNLGHVRSSPNVHGQTNEKRPSGKLT